MIPGTNFMLMHYLCQFLMRFCPYPIYLSVQESIHNIIFLIISSVLRDFLYLFCVWLPMFVHISLVVLFMLLYIHTVESLIMNILGLANFGKNFIIIQSLFSSIGKIALSWSCRDHKTCSLWRGQM